jgi:hypothetical protein
MGAFERGATRDHGVITGLKRHVCEVFHATIVIFNIAIF